MNSTPLKLCNNIFWKYTNTCVLKHLQTTLHICTVWCYRPLSIGVGGVSIAQSVVVWSWRWSWVILWLSQFGRSTEVNFTLDTSSKNLLIRRSICNLYYIDSVLRILTFTRNPLSWIITHKGKPQTEDVKYRPWVGTVGNITKILICPIARVMDTY